MKETFLNGRVKLLRGDCLELLPTLEENSIDSCVTDPPYHLTSIVKRFGSPNAAECQFGKDGAYKRASRGFMNKMWDGGDIAFRPELWAEVLRVLKHGAHLLAFSGTRTYHRMACAIEDAGFEIRDQIGWCYGSGFPKSHDIAKHIDRAAGHWRGRAGAITIAEQVAKGTEYERNDKGDPITPEAIQWQGWGTALKPAWEPIVLARKPLSESSIAANVLKHGTGAINVDGCRIAADWKAERGEAWLRSGNNSSTMQEQSYIADRVSHLGRWPANLIHDGSEEVLERFPDVHGAGSARNGKFGSEYAATSYDLGCSREMGRFGDTGSSARFFYTAKADADDRLGSKHPTVKPLDLMQYLVRLVTPKGGLVLDPFAGTGTTGEAAWREGMRAALIEREEEYQADIVKRMGLCLSGPDERRAKSVKQLPHDDLPMFRGSL